MNVRHFVQDFSYKTEANCQNVSDFSDFLMSVIFHNFFDYFVNVMQPMLKLLVKFDIFQMFTNICINFNSLR